MTDSLTGDGTLHLPEFDRPPADPAALLEAWLRRAAERDVREALAATLATASRDGVPSSRTVQLKEMTADEVRFGTSAASRKGRDLAENPLASVTVYWRELLQQLRIDGSVEVLDDAASDRLFADRPAAARAATLVSRQSAALDEDAALRAAARAALDAGELRRPEDWHAYRLIPSVIEFWHGSPDRLHRRLRYRRTGSTWAVERLQP